MVVGGYGTSAAGALVLLIVALVVFVLIPLAWMVVVNQLGVPADDTIERRGLAGWMDRRRKRAADRAFEGQTARMYVQRKGGKWPKPPPKGQSGGRLR